MSETTTLETLSLRQRAASAYAQTRQERQAEEAEERERLKASFQKLASEVLGVGPESITYDQRNGRPVMVVDGLVFGIYHDDYRDTLQLLSVCEKCGGQMAGHVYSLERIGELLVDPAKFYHHCPRKQDDTPEARLLSALRDLIVKNAPEYQS